MSTTIIIGGGISGLLAAWHLQSRGDEVEVWEAEPTVGGWVQTLPWAGPNGEKGRVEKGPQGVLVRKDSPSDKLFKALDLNVISPGKGARWVGKNGKLIPVPAHPVGLVFSALMSWSTKLRMFMEPFQPVGSDAQEESLSDFIARRAGAGMATELLPAMVAGILAAPPHLLSIDALPMLKKWESHGSLFNGVRKSGVSHLMVPEGGMGSLTKRLAQLGPTPSTRLRVHALERLPNGKWRVMASQHTVDADRVILAIPAFEAAKLLGPHAPAAAEALQAIPYTSVKLWHSRHPKLKPYCDGFGFLIDPPSGRPYLGTLVPSWIDKGCCPPDLMQLRSFIGDSALWEDADPQTPKDWPWTEARLQQWLPNLGKAIQTREEVSLNAIPRPEMGHRTRINQALGYLPPGVDWVSNARFGPGVRDVIEGLEGWRLTWAAGSGR